MGRPISPVCPLCGHLKSKHDLLGCEVIDWGIEPRTCRCRKTYEIWKKKHSPKAGKVKA